jgi:hypothetical protein
LPVGVKVEGWQPLAWIHIKINNNAANFLLRCIFISGILDGSSSLLTIRHDASGHFCRRLIDNRSVRRESPIGECAL